MVAWWALAFFSSAQIAKSSVSYLSLMRSDDTCVPTFQEGQTINPCVPRASPVPTWDEQKTGNCPFLGTLVNERVMRNDFMVKDEVFEIMQAFGFSDHEINSHIDGNFKSHRSWQVEGCNKTFWLVHPLRMEGLMNEHDSSTGISDCPTDWNNCKFDPDMACALTCAPDHTPDYLGSYSNFYECKAKQPGNKLKFEVFWNATKHWSIDNSVPYEYITTCELLTFGERDANWAKEVWEANPSTNFKLVEDFHVFIRDWVGFRTDRTSVVADAAGLTGNLTQVNTPQGGRVGGSIAAGYMDLAFAFGTPTGNECDDGRLEYKLKKDDLETIDFTRSFPVGFIETATGKKLEAIRQNLLQTTATTTTFV